MSEWDYAATGYGGLGMPESVEVDPSILTEPSPKILLMGSRRSGKSSIYRVLFSKMSPHETLFLDSTNALEISRIANNKLITFQICNPNPNPKPNPNPNPNANPNLTLTLT
uniref:Uncharacterized protein n=1 Tax=Phaeomonas parva TaxID=124430 RepID=A0A6U4EMY4_9STRA|mmetsp:Transcript_21672/g.66360  ORF Transcript_21672/g.66360 Transcript_21672/m.66360 type:complete len:111 (+) Transcript_21672:76-408(+)